MYTDSPMRSLDDKGNYKLKLSLLKIATEREMCRGRGWGLDLQGGFGGRKSGGRGFTKIDETRRRRSTKGDRREGRGGCWMGS